MNNSRVITVVSTKGGQIEKVSTDAKTWGDLKDLIEDKYDLINLKATENINKTTLEHKDAILPEGDFRLFLRPAKTKSGSIENIDSADFKTLRQMVIELGARGYLNTIFKDKNWTQLSTLELREGLKNYVNSNNKVTVEVKVETSRNYTPLDEGETSTNLTPLGENKASIDTTEVTNDEIESLLNAIYKDFEVLSNSLDELYVKIVGLINSYVSKSSIESKKDQKERLEKEDIERELRELEEGF